MSASDLSRDRAPGNCGGLTGRLVAYRRSAPAFVLMGVCLAGVAFAASSARAEAVVRLGGRIEATDAGGALVRARVVIASGYHINAHEPDEPFLIPTVLSLDAGGLAFTEPVYPKPESQTFPFAPDKPMLVYDGTIEITTSAERMPDGPVVARLRYQACTHERCLPPRTVQAVLGSEDAADARREKPGSIALAGVASPGLSPAQAGVGIRWQPLTAGALDRAITAGQPAVVEFSARWCPPCLEMERSTFMDPGVLRDATGFSMLQADVTESNANNDRLMEKFAVLGVPTIIFYDRNGREVDRAVGFVDADGFRTYLRRARETSRRRAPSPPPVAEPA